jgi:hypothetical protein
VIAISELVSTPPMEFMTFTTGEEAKGMQEAVLAEPAD